MVCGNSIISCVPFPVIWLHGCYMTAPITLLYCHRLHIIRAAATECLALLTPQLLGSNSYKKPTQTSVSASVVGPPVQLALNWRQQYNTAAPRSSVEGKEICFSLCLMLS